MLIKESNGGHGFIYDTDKQCGNLQIYSTYTGGFLSMFVSGDSGTNRYFTAPLGNGAELVEWLVAVTYAMKTNKEAAIGTFEGIVRIIRTDAGALDFKTGNRWTGHLGDPQWLVSCLRATLLKLGYSLIELDHRTG